MKIWFIVLWDLDNLKYVNDTYGHDYGDIYIRKAATVLKQFEQYGGIVARRSGDEFFVFIYGFNDKSEIKSIVERVHDDVENTRISLPNGRTLKIRASTKTLESFVQNRERFGDRKLFINSIPNYVLVNEDLEKFEKMYGRYLNNLVVEILENEHSDTEGTSEKINLISRWNSEVAIDDFGSGYNNESVLLTMTPNYVKIDMEIVRGVHKDLNRQQICKNLITYAKQRNIKIVAEGVEYIEELEKLIELGVDFIQGYFFSKPDFIPPVIAEEKKEIVVEINRRLKENMK